jgi:hypothetical protein
LEGSDTQIADYILNLIREEEARSEAIKAEEKRQAVATLLQLIDVQDSSDISTEQSFNREQVQEQEQEQEQEQAQEKEKEKEEEKVDEIEDEDFLKQNYSRDDEDPVPWRINELSKVPNLGKTNFFPMADLAMHKTGLGSKISESLHFPEYMWMSKNHFKLEWTWLKTLRRLKNVIVVMEYKPQVSEGFSAGKGFFEGTTGLKRKNFTPEQEAAVSRAFKLCDLDKDEFLTNADMIRMF